MIKQYDKDVSIVDATVDVISDAEDDERGEIEMKSCMISG